MLENSKILERIDRKEVFAAMLRELDWDDLKAFLQANSQIHKMCTIGGHRLEKKRRKRFEKIICREAEKKDFPAEICSGLFAQWYPAQGELHDQLEAYFESEDYEKYRQEQDLDEGDYALPEDVLERLFDAKDIQRWRILLCFSPLKFTDEQSERILEEATGSEEALQQVYDIQAEADKTRKENNRLANENTDLRRRLDELSGEDQKLRTERKELRTERDALAKKFEAAQVENQRLRDEISQVEQNRKKQRQKVEQNVERDQKRLLSDLQQVKAELSNWKEKYEKQRADSRCLQDELKNAEKALASERTTRMAKDKEHRNIQSFADAVLSRIDWKEVGRELHLTPQLKRKFNSLMRSLKYEKDRTITLGGTLDDFWRGLQTQETELLNAIADSDTREVQNGDVEEYWNSLTDNFEDVTIGLEARNLLLQILREIFYQTLSMENLEEATAPGVKKRKKSAAGKS